MWGDMGRYTASMFACTSRYRAASSRSVWIRPSRAEIAVAVAVAVAPSPSPSPGPIPDQVSEEALGLDLAELGGVVGGRALEEELLPGGRGGGGGGGLGLRVWAWAWVWVWVWVWGGD